MLNIFSFHALFIYFYVLLIIQKHRFSLKQINKRRTSLLFQHRKPLPLSSNGLVYLRVVVSLKWRVFNEPVEHQNMKKQTLEKIWKMLVLASLEVTNGK